MYTLRYVLGVMLVITMPPAIVYWFVIHPFVGVWRRIGPRLAITINVALLIAGIVGLFFVRDPLLGRDLGASLPGAISGVLLIVVAAVMGWKRKRYLTFGVLAGVPELQADGKGGKLLTEGPYAVIRHPRYVEVVFGCFGYALIANFLGGYLLSTALLPVLHVLVLIEERELSARFGEAYDAYRAVVPRYVPRARVRGG